MAICRTSLAALAPSTVATEFAVHRACHGVAHPLLGEWARITTVQCVAQNFDRTSLHAGIATLAAGGPRQVGVLAIYSARVSVAVAEFSEVRWALVATVSGLPVDRAALGLHPTSALLGTLVEGRPA
jgi:hypothetical protein